MLLMAGGFLLSRCAKEYSYEGGPGRSPGNDTTGTTEPDVPAEWRFMENNQLFKGPVDTAWLTIEGNGQIITATGKSSNGNENITIYLRSLSGVIEKNKTYQTSLEQIKFLYTIPNDTIYSAVPYYGGDIYFTVTDINERKIVGTFKGIALDARGRSLPITEGKFSSPLKAKPSSIATGSVMLWAKESCAGSAIRVKVNNQPATITTLSWITPQCGEQGRANYNLPPGSYPWVAYCGTDSISGIVDVKANNCSKILISFPFAPADTTTTIPNVSCRISQINFDGKLLPFKLLPNNINANYSGNEVVSLTYTVLFGATPITGDHPVNYEGNKIFIDKNTGYDKYFIVDANQKIIEYSGDTDPSIGYPRGRLLKINYAYDNAGNLRQRLTKNATNLTPLHEMNFTWENGNLVKLDEQFPGSGQRKETLYEYYTTKTVKASPWLNFSALELLYFQPAINFGNSSKNPVKKVSVTSFDASGNIMSFYVLDYKNYVIDNNQYILAQSIADDFNQSNYYGFQYYCF